MRRDEKRRSEEGKGKTENMGETRGRKEGERGESVEENSWHY